MLGCRSGLVRHAGPVTVDSWDDAETWFIRFALDREERGRMSAINLSLLQGARFRWSVTLESFLLQVGPPIL